MNSRRFAASATGAGREKMIVRRREVEDLRGLEEYYRIESGALEK